MTSDAVPMLEVSDVRKAYRTKHGLVHAVDGVSLSINEGETVGLVGESGCGKSSLGRVVAGIVEPTSGEVRLQGQRISGLSRRQMRPYRRLVQFVFQDPHASLNPRTRIGRILEEPLIVHGVGNRSERRERVERLLERVGLPATAMQRLPHEFSGGQRQRVGIARALALEPKVVVCDEPVSALDVSVQAQVLNLLAKLQRDSGISYLFISHDLSVVRHISDRVAVMFRGRLVEIASHEDIWRDPKHPYTRSLIAAVPNTNPGAKREREVLPEDTTDTNTEVGCKYFLRCPIRVERCRIDDPSLRQVGDQHSAACHLA
jgi:oligopeptide/dipeptide ABC transporter ATP-binding protein